MSDMPVSQEPAAEDKAVPVIAYILYLVGLTHGLTIIIAVILAYANRDKAGAVNASHYNWIIRTFWLSIAWVLLAAVLILLGIPFLLVGIGFLMIGAGLAIYSLTVLWTIIRLVLGLIYLSKDQAYPRPSAVLV
ncbi:MAG: hypothetical protein JWM33_71 [Caulobacteraceae bacterium]|nr:hypothetical protein [Caulobacteraceae bacterium]